MSKSITRKGYLAGAAAAVAATLPWPLAAQTAPMLKVGTGKIEPQAEAYYALDSGIFTRFGLNVDVETLTNAGITSSAVASGDLQIGATTCLNIAQARQHNLPFVGVVPGAVQFQHQSNGGLVVAPSASIATAKDLNGKSIAIETLNGLAELTIKAMVDQAGGDSTTLQFIEMPSASMTDAVLNGRLAGAYLQDPAFTANAVGGPYVSIVWFTTTDWLAKNKDIARKFANAIYASGQWAMNNPQLAAASLDKHLGIKVPAATQKFATQLDISAFRRLFDLAAKYKYIAPVDPATIIWNGK
jgi:ABC-type nitrate/sulfonate/bicarbonate transport system substrate-binding protein